MPKSDTLTADMLEEDLKTPLETLRQYLPADKRAVAGIAQQLANIADLGLDHVTTMTYLLEGLQVHRQQAPAQEILGVPDECRHIFM
jgi:hypothetical protein